MRTASFIISAIVCVVEVATCWAEAPARPRTNGLGVVIKSIRAFHSYAEFDIEVWNHIPEAILVSQFSLATAVRNVKLSDANGHGWKVESPKIIEQPPPDDEAYTYSIQAKSTNRITITTPALTIVRTATPGRSFPQGEPGEVRYELSREVGTITTMPKKFKWVLCTGAGKTTISWPRKPKP